MAGGEAHSVSSDFSVAAYSNFSFSTYLHIDISVIGSLCACTQKGSYVLSKLLKGG